MTLAKIKSAAGGKYRQLFITMGIPEALYALFERAPLLSDEDPNAYWAMLSQFAHDIQPFDSIAWIWLKDVADLSWGVVRYRAIETALIDAARKSAVATLFAPVGDHVFHDTDYHGAWD